VTVYSWIMPWGQLAWLRKLDDPTARAAFDTTSSYVIGGAVPGYQCLPVRMFPTLSGAGGYTSTVLTAGAWVCYDLEGWAASRPKEQQHPELAYDAFLDQARARGHPVIAAPARDLATVKGADATKLASETYDQAYVRIGYAGMCTGAQVLLVQSQNAQKDLDAFTALLNGAKSQQADPNQALWCGLTTAAATTVNQLAAAWTAALGLGVSGCWLTIGGADQAQVAADFLKWAV